ncbi:ABC transporter ATP-binding protein [Pseudovibrio denitrificans]|uniref:ABC transporter ATP-binding protein n=1 Tax=Pseudovibrio denitrificans TaxID=258256 RepID=UPI0039BEF6C4
MPAKLSIKNLSKTYSTGFRALKNVNLCIEEGEILALLGSNGAGKTTLISILCGIIKPSSGVVKLGQYDIQRDYRKVRSMIGLVPQELYTDAFEKVINAVRFSRGLFNKPTDHDYIEQLLKELSLWDKRNSQVKTLSGGMKRRLLLAKALAHEPEVLFMDEPTAGVDVELRNDMWRLMTRLRGRGVTIILTTHYLEEAEILADKVCVINQGKIMLMEDKEKLRSQYGSKRLILHLQERLTSIPENLKDYDVTMSDSADQLNLSYNQQDENCVSTFFDELRSAEIRVADVSTRETSLEEIFVSLVGKDQ